VKAALTNAMGRVAAVAQVHRKLYTSHDVQRVLLDQYLQGLLEDLRRSAEGEKLTQLTLACEPLEIDPDRAVAIGIVVNELVINALKYAYPAASGPIHVEASRTGELIAIAVRDQGIGISADPAPGSTGLGRRIVDAMATKLNATIKFDSGPSGTHVTLTLPFSREAKAPKQSAA
jgi:two-component sensor histidine kinase